MIELQDKKIMHQYFTDMLFRPMAEAVAETLEQKQEVREPVKVETELLPLPTTEHQTVADAGANAKAIATTDCQEELIGGEEEFSPDRYWSDYQWDNQRPPWAQKDFDCLLFEVCGFNFAVPLITLGQIQLVSDKLSPVFGQAPWFMGIQSAPIGKLRIVNTAQFVMPERYQPDAHYRPAYMISIAHCNWALAVDKVNQPISLTPDSVKWRVNRERQNWLAGVLKEQMCVLIDVPALAKQLINSDKNTNC